MVDESKQQQVQLIQRISDQVWEVYENITTVENLTKAAKLGISKTTNVKVDAVVLNLKAFSELCMDPITKVKIHAMITDVENMPFHGSTQTFLAHNVKTSATNKLEFVCVAIRKKQVNVDGKTHYLCDYCLSTFTYSKSIDVVGVGVGAGVAAAAVGLGAISAVSIATGGVGLIIGGSVAALFAAFAAVGGSAQIAASVSTEFETNFNTILEASFLYELVQRGHAHLNDRRELLMLL